MSTPVYDRMVAALDKTDRFISSCGGTRSGKTYAALELLYKIAARDRKPTVTSIVSETFPHLKRGAIRDFQLWLGDRWNPDAWSKGESIYTLPNGSILEFFSADTPAKVHGPARDRLFLNEGINISYEIARQLFVRTKGLIVIDYNPISSCWINEEIESRPNCETVHSTYLDNSYLTPEQVAEIEANRKDRNWWTVYGEGKVGILDGVIYEFEQIDSMPSPEGLREVWGMDFGFTHDPTAIVRVLADTGRKIAYIDEKCYKRGMLNSDISSLLTRSGLTRGVSVWADSAEPKSIAEIGADTGFNIRSCDKSAPVRSDRRKFQIQWMQGWTLRVTKASLNWIKEARNYTWQKDRDGKPLDVPIDGWDHLLDATRYALFSEFAGSTPGRYSFSVGGAAAFKSQQREQYERRHY